MGLYLCALKEGVDIDGIDVGAYSDYQNFLEVITDRLQRGMHSSKFPTLMRASNCDGEWRLDDLPKLKNELTQIRDAFGQLPPTEYPSKWQREVASLLGISASSLASSFIDVDGEDLCQRMIDLCETALEHGATISFQ